MRASSYRSTAGSRLKTVGLWCGALALLFYATSSFTRDWRGVVAQAEQRAAEPSQPSARTPHRPAAKKLAEAPAPAAPVNVVAPARVTAAAPVPVRAEPPAPAAAPAPAVVPVAAPARAEAPARPQVDVTGSVKKAPEPAAPAPAVEAARAPVVEAAVRPAEPVEHPAAQAAEPPSADAANPPATAQTPAVETPNAQAQPAAQRASRPRARHRVAERRMRTAERGTARPIRSAPRYARPSQPIQFYLAERGN